MFKRPILRISQISLALAGAFFLAHPAKTAQTDVSNEPLAQAASAVQPNIMFILDNSGSMAWDYSPDYVNDTQSTSSDPGTTASCFDSGDAHSFDGSKDFDDSDGSITGVPDACVAGDPPHMSPDFNKQYYNPAIYYRPPTAYDGAEYTNLNSANTTAWTVVPTDPYGVQQKNMLGSSETNSNLVSDFPDRVWCKTTAASATGPDCVTNSDYSYPNWEYRYGRTGINQTTRKYRYGAPYYYRMQTAQWCTSSAGTTCVSGSSVTPGTHTFIKPEFCTDTELTNCAAGAGVTAAHVHSGPRWCSDKNTLLTCQRKKVGNFKWPKHLGVTKTVTVTTVAAQPATGTINVTSVTSGRSITALTIGGTSRISGSITAASSSTSAFAAQIAAAITGPYTATASGSVVTITSTGTGTVENKSISVTANSTGVTAATGWVEVESDDSTTQYYSNVSVGGNNLMSFTTSCSGNTSWGNGVSITNSGRIDADNATNSSAERQAMAEAIKDCINHSTGSNGGYTATRSGDRVNITAPVSLGATVNGANVSVSQYRATYTKSNMSGGTSATISTTVSGLAGGANAITGTQPLRVGVGYFSRIDIVSTNNSYAKASARIDCSGTDCTYAEEMTNFANWYAYYRTRLQMMKTAAGRAFLPIDETYRVGFITINTGSPVSSDRYLRINGFDDTHKSAWYTKFYSQGTSGSTPLREALSRVGRLYAGKFTGINDGIPTTDDPMTVSCQPNFAILSTDGYWNGNAGDDLSGNSIAQQDNVDSSPYSKRSDGVYDGGSSGTVGLADVALYYYKTDLRPAGSISGSNGANVSADNVPTTQLDFAAHQHMTTFTLGLGLDGFKTYRSDYQTATSGDFWNIKQGTDNWPNPVSDNPAALDDLWHAAVNGRGVFFSASNPTTLASSLSDTLDALRTRVGAGAAAATSNLQPVAGDNFAFTAQYQTQDWVGDLRARTIDLSTGDISSVELWSAQSKLNARAHTDRKIFTLDTSDTLGNKLKHFCMPADVGAAWCNDGTGLTATEQAYFNPNLLNQWGGLTAAQQTNATTQRLVNYLRGEQTFEDLGTALATDLFRSRIGLLGDIVNAQPSYVKASPFNYSDTGYADFKKCTNGTANAASITCPSAQFPDQSLPRRATVYVSANDGMVHAIETDVNNNPYYQTAGIATTITSDDTFSTGNNTGNGEERWAYIPEMVLDGLRKLANKPYTHKYFVDGTPTVGDICVSAPCAGLSDWRTIMVGGMNSGGRGVYALDITNPLAPKGMWEFKVRKPSVTACAVTTAGAIGATDDCDLGLTYGNPVITKRKVDGKWVVIVTSGVNNSGQEAGTTNRQGDGKGYLYVLDAVTGAILHKIGTGVGDGGTAGANYTDASPSGLSRINNWTENGSVDNTTLAVYGGDMLGNMWRFDLDNSKGTYLTAVKVATVASATSTVQPITAKPELAEINSRRVIFFGTGRFLGVSDKSSTAAQSIYAIADDTTGDTAVSGRTGLVAQTLSAINSTSRTATSNAVDWTNASVRGWFIDLPDSGERVTVDPALQLGTLVVASNVPSNETCVAGGTGWLNFLDYKTGSFVPGASANAVSTKISSSVAVGLNVVQLPGGKIVTIVTTADNQQLTYETPVVPTTFEGKRVSWRELTVDR